MTATLTPSAPPTLEGSRAVKTKDLLFRLSMFACIGIALVVLAALLYSVITEGLPKFNMKLLTDMPANRPGRAGAQSAIMGSLWVVGLTALIAMPLGIAAAVYLEEFADPRKWYNRMFEVNILNLAAVPSVVYGILALGFVVKNPLGLGRSVLAGAIALALLVLPVIIIASREAIRAVPPSIRHGALALGATPLQVVRRLVLPLSVPGIATGSILALSRAIGEAAPLLLVTGVTYITYNPTGLDSAFTVMPLQIFEWTRRPQTEFHELAAALIMVLLIMLLVMNSIAIFLRNRYSRKW